jgi:hypothetical protein
MTGSSKVVFENQRRYRMELAINHALREVLHMLWGQVNATHVKDEVIVMPNLSCG